MRPAGMMSATTRTLMDDDGDDDDMIARMNSAAQWRSAHYTRPVRSSISILLWEADSSRWTQLTHSGVSFIIVSRWICQSCSSCVSQQLFQFASAQNFKFHFAAVTGVFTAAETRALEERRPPPRPIRSGFGVCIWTSNPDNFQTWTSMFKVTFVVKIFTKIRSVFPEIWAKLWKMPYPAILRKIPGSGPGNWWLTKFNSSSSFTDFIADIQADRQQTNKRWALHNLLGGCEKHPTFTRATTALRDGDNISC